MITVLHNKGTERRVMLKEEDKIRLFTYYKTIPEPVRPRYHSTDPLLAQTQHRLVNREFCNNQIFIIQIYYFLTISDM